MGGGVVLSTRYHNTLNTYCCTKLSSDSKTQSISSACSPRFINSKNVWENKNITYHRHLVHTLSGSCDYHKGFLTCIYLPVVY